MVQSAWPRKGNDAGAGVRLHAGSAAGRVLFQAQMCSVVMIVANIYAQKGLPAKCRLRAFRRSAHPARNGSFGDVDSELEQFAMNSWRTPRWIFGHHAEG
jgi:hypothetical protein